MSLLLRSVTGTDWHGLKHVKSNDAKIEPEIDPCYLESAAGTLTSKRFDVQLIVFSFRKISISL